VEVLAVEKEVKPPVSVEEKSHDPRTPASGVASESAGEVGKHRYRIDKALVYVLKNSKAEYIAETSDFLEMIYQYGNLVCIYNTDTATYMLIQFKDENDAKKFKDAIVKIAEVVADALGIDRSPFLFTHQRAFIKTFVSCFDDAKIICYTHTPSDRFDDIIYRYAWKLQY
jgi:hypothetical protein